MKTMLKHLLAVVLIAYAFAETKSKWGVASLNDLDFSSKTEDKSPLMAVESDDDDVLMVPITLIQGDDAKGAGVHGDKHEARPSTIKTKVVVAQDGTGQFKTIKEAINAAPKNVKQKFIIRVKAGVYQEYVVIPANLYNVMMIGDGPTNTIIAGNRSQADGYGVDKSATVTVLGDNFIAQNISFQNKAGAIKYQAVALLVDADRCIFYNCNIDGNQDTLYVYNHRQFFRDCTISGTIDFIFGRKASAVFQNCKLVVKKPLKGQECMVMAQGRNESSDKGAIVLQHCSITAEQAFLDTNPWPKAFLGRPWAIYSRTIVMQSSIDRIIDPKGWAPWDNNTNSTIAPITYGEYNNSGPGSNINERIRWKGVMNFTLAQALEFTPGAFIDGNAWIEDTGIPYEPGMKF